MPRCITPAREAVLMHAGNSREDPERRAPRAGIFPGGGAAGRMPPDYLGGVSGGVWAGVAASGAGAGLAF